MAIKDTLQSALQMRIDEIDMYQVNINNFKYAIEEIESGRAGDGLEEFADQLRQLLKENVHEQRKSRLILNAIQRQLSELQ
jgi:hypothetical protein